MYRTTLSPDDAERLPEWKDRKDAQWARISAAMAGLQLVTTREGGNQYMLVCHREADEARGVPEFYEGVLIGQLPLTVMERIRVRTGVARDNRVVMGRRPMPDHKKPLHKRGVDLSDEEIDQVLERWRVRRSALGLPFVTAVWGRDGRMVVEG
ncbi:MAG TPA: hypothetical protein VGF29_05995 [Hyphomicrobiaceae bacterium]|jgi:hypothetical protein